MTPRLDATAAKLPDQELMWHQVWCAELDAGDVDVELCNSRYFLVFTPININCASMVALDGYMTSISLSIHQRQQLLCPVKVASLKKKGVRTTPTVLLTTWKQV